MNASIHPDHGVRSEEPRVHGRLYELFHDARFWAVVLTVSIVVGVYLIAKMGANTIQSSFSYQPTFSP